MHATEFLTLLNILVAFLGVLVVAFTAFEWWKLRDLKKELAGVEERLAHRMRDGIRAAHRVIASYAVKDPEERIRLLASARAIDPECFNALNGMGYAYLEMGKTAEAIDAFSLAVHAFPQDKAGYCDLAYAYKVAGETDLCLKYLRRAVEVDASARDDVARDPRFADVRDGV